MPLAREDQIREAAGGSGEINRAIAGVDDELVVGFRCQARQDHGVQKAEGRVDSLTGTHLEHASNLTIPVLVQVHDSVV